MNDVPPHGRSGTGRSTTANGGESPQLLLQFTETAFLIAAGLRKREDLFLANPQRYPYCHELREGIQRFAALHLQYAQNDQAIRELLANLSESSFIRTWCTREISAWVEHWSPAARLELRTLDCMKLGPLAEVSGSFFSITEECEDLLRLNGNGSLDDLHELQVFDMLKSAGQAAYVFGRKFLILHPMLSWDEHSAIMRADITMLGPDPLDQGELQRISETWLKELVGIAYEQVPQGLKTCPVCGWTMSLHGLRPMCLTAACTAHVDAERYDTLPDIAPNSFRLRRGVMRYIAKPGALELHIARSIQKLGLPFELWPHLDTCDILVTPPGGRTIAVDAKDQRNLKLLARNIEADNMLKATGADEAVYVIPADTPVARRRSANRQLMNRPGHSCKTPHELTQFLKHEMEEAR